MPEKQTQTIDLVSLVELLSIPLYPDALNVSKGKFMANDGIFEAAPGKGRYNLIKSIRGYVGSLLEKIYGDSWVKPGVLAEHLGITIKEVAALNRAGVFPDYKRALYSMAKCRVNYINHLKGGGEQAKDTNSWKTEGEKWAALKKKAEYEQLSGTLVNKSEVISEQISRELEFKKSFMRLPRDLSIKLVGCGLEEINAELTTFVTRGFKKLARKK